MLLSEKTRQKIGSSSGGITKLNSSTKLVEWL